MRIPAASGGRSVAASKVTPMSKMVVTTQSSSSSTGDTHYAIHHLLAAQQADRALALLQDRVAADFLRDPAAPGPLDLSMIDPSSLTDAPDQLLALAAHLLTWGDPGPRQPVP